MNSSDPIRLPPSEGQSQGNEADPGRMLQILWRGKWILVLVPLLAYFGAQHWLDTRIPLYTASAQVQVDARQVNVLKSGAGEAINKPRTVLKQQQSLLKSTTLLKRIAESPALQGLATFAPERLGDKTMLGELYDNLQTGIDVESDRLFVTYLSPYREDAVVVVDETLRIYIEYHKQKKREEATNLADIVRREWSTTTQELEEASRAIAALQAEHALLAGTDRTPLQTKLDNASTAMHAAHLETQRLQAIWRELADASGDEARFRERGLYWRAKAPLGPLEERVKALQSRREQRQEELARLERPLGPGHERLAQLRAEIEALRTEEQAIGLEYARHYLQSTEVDYQRARLYEEGLARDQQELLAQITDQNVVLDRLKDLGLAREQLRARVAGFDERITQLGLENETGALNLDVIEYARAGMRPTYPESEKTLIYALGGSGILAFGLVLLLGLADRRVREVEDVPKLLGTSVLGVLPQLPGGSDRVKIGRVVEEDPHSLAAEAIRSARTATIFALPGGRGVVTVTSAQSGEGKSVCASNLAFSLAKAGRKTLLIDADMRKPAQHLIYAVENGVGLAGMLASSAPLKAAILNQVAHGLDLMPAGDARGKAAELCEGQVLVQLLQSLRETYECIVIDSPPVLETSEARVLAALADSTVFVLRMDQSKAPGLKRAAGILRGAGARILGALPNGAASRRGARAYAGGISYGQAGVQAVRAPEVSVEGETDKTRGRGTDFLGLEEESA